MKNQFAIICTILLTFGVMGNAEALSIYQDADNVATGSELDTTPLVTPAGTITYTGNNGGGYGGDPEFLDAGAEGYVFGVGHFDVDFDVWSLRFIYGGNAGSILVEAKDVEDEQWTLFIKRVPMVENLLVHSPYLVLGFVACGGVTLSNLGQRLIT